jgi:hypothetical protein
MSVFRLDGRVTEYSGQTGQFHYKTSLLNGGKLQSVRSVPLEDSALAVSVLFNCFDSRLNSLSITCT